MVLWLFAIANGGRKVVLLFLLWVEVTVAGVVDMTFVQHWQFGQSVKSVVAHGERYALAMFPSRGSKCSALWNFCFHALEQKWETGGGVAFVVIWEGDGAFVLFVF